MSTLMRFTRRPLVGLLLIGLLCDLQAAGACSLALHEWQPRFQFAFAPPAPILLLSELDLVRERVREGRVSRVFQVTAPSVLTALLGLVPPLLQPGIRWQAVSSPHLVQPLFLSPASGSAPLLLGTDRQTFRVALFSDLRSGSCCHQLVLYESKRIRAIHGLAASPWAREADGRAWISIVFYEYPVPGRILSVSVFPVEGRIREVYTAPELVETLIGQRRLQLRPASAFTPDSRDIPEMPE
ncbi:MAG TPA: hypothetical protein VIV61_01540 [Candidatus Ozemobacteraceae bacterium]